MPVPTFQKPLGWFQRYLYNVEYGDIPFPNPSVDISLDWPLQWSHNRSSYATIAGSVATTVYQPDNEHHGLVVGVTVQVTSLANFVASDTLTLTLEDTGSLRQWTIHFWNNVAAPHATLVGGRTSLTGGVCVVGCDPMYIPPGFKMTINHGSVAGGVNHFVDSMVLERFKYYPLRIP